MVSGHGEPVEPRTTNGTEVRGLLVYFVLSFISFVSCISSLREAKRRSNLEELSQTKIATPHELRLAMTRFGLPRRQSTSSWLLAMTSGIPMPEARSPTPEALSFCHLLPATCHLSPAACCLPLLPLLHHSRTSFPLLPCHFLHFLHFRHFRLRLHPTPYTLHPFLLPFRGSPVSQEPHQETHAHRRGASRDVVPVLAQPGRSRNV
jgi:hypothetical protein